MSIIPIYPIYWCIYHNLKTLISSLYPGGGRHTFRGLFQPSVGCSCHFISEMKLKSGKRATLRHPICCWKIKHYDFQIYVFIFKCIFHKRLAMINIDWWLNDTIHEDIFLVNIYILILWNMFFLTFCFRIRGLRGEGIIWVINS